MSFARRPSPADRLQLCSPPYREFHDIDGPAFPSRWQGRPGLALLWSMSAEPDEELVLRIIRRPSSMALVAVLPPAEWVVHRDLVYRIVERTHPVAVLPFHEDPAPSDLCTLLSEPPESVPAAVLDHLVWRGLPMDAEVRRLVYRTLELSAQLRSVQALSRGLYVSRRALGRRFFTADLPVPSKWLQFGRMLHACVRIQAEIATVHDIARDLGYADGFALSNQMQRVLALRPQVVRDHLGIGWIIDLWLTRELAREGFRGACAHALTTFTDTTPTPPSLGQRSRAPRSSRIEGEVEER